MIFITVKKWNDKIGRCPQYCISRHSDYKSTMATQLAVGILGKYNLNRINHSKKILILLFLFFFQMPLFEMAALKAAEPVSKILRIPIIRDTWVSAVNDEKCGNNGSDQRLKLKGQQEFTLVDFDAETLKGLIIEKAILHMRSSTPGSAPSIRLGGSTIAAPWEEGNGKRYRKEIGSACFAQAMYKKRYWTYPGSTVLDAVFGKGRTIWRFSDCTPPDADGWQACAIQPEVISTRVAGISHGICLFDEVGSIWSQKKGRFDYHYFPNRFFYSRENRSGPWLEVWVRGNDITPPEPIDHIDVQTKGLPGGEALCIWDTPRDYGGGNTLGFYVTYEKDGQTYPVPRYLIPMAGTPGQSVRMHLQDLGFASGESISLQIKPVDSAGNVGPATSKSFSSATGAPLPAFQTLPMAAPFGTNIISGSSGATITVLDLLDKVDPINGNLIPSGQSVIGSNNHLFDSKNNKIVLHAARNETIWFQLNITNCAKKVTFGYNFEQHPGLKWHFFKFAHVPYTKNGKKRWAPDPLIPLGSEFMISNPFENKMGNVDNRSFLCELYVPHYETSGIKTGAITICVDDEVFVLSVELTVWDFILPDKLSFIPEMNAYSGVSPYKSYDYYILAHEHRTCLNRLPYGWNGQPEFAPVWSGKDFDWKTWDRHVGPLLDGSAFKGLKRDGEPLDVMYLPFSENWPIDIYSNYTPSFWADEALSDQYRSSLGFAFSSFAAHIQEKGWNDTIYEFYLNNKVYYRTKYAQSSAPWIFDEPVNTQDFWALRWYGLLWQEAVTPFRRNTPLWFRADISYSQYARDLLWGVLDVEYTGGNSFQKVRMKRDEWRLWEPLRYFEYGSANKIDQTNTHPVFWCLSAWSRGAIGVLPWQTIGSEKSWETADQNALFYPHKNGPIPSVRLKAFTYGQQLVEYLTLFAKIYDLPHHTVVKWLRSQVSLDGHVDKQSERDAGTIALNNVTPADLRALRWQLGEMISAKSPSYQQALVDFTEGVPVRRKPVATGYVSPAPDVESMKPDCDRFKH